jgi:hypothetical protein
MWLSLQVCVNYSVVQTLLCPLLTGSLTGTARLVTEQWDRRAYCKVQNLRFSERVLSFHFIPYHIPHYAFLWVVFKLIRRNPSEAKNIQRQWKVLIRAQLPRSTVRCPGCITYCHCLHNGSLLSAGNRRTIFLGVTVRRPAKLNRPFGGALSQISGSKSWAGEPLCVVFAQLTLPTWRCIASFTSSIAVLVGRPERKRLLRDQDVGGWIILTWVLGWYGLMWLRIAASGGLLWTQ